MKILFLIAPSEGKNNTADIDTGTDLDINNTKILSFDFKKPLDIAYNASEKDLKCSANRYTEGIKLNQNITNMTYIESKKIAAIYRYSGVMYSAINYICMNKSGQTFFEDNFLILSGMHGLLKPLDWIGNYKLPIETKGLYKFWGDKIVDKLIEIKPNYIINLLPMSYAKMAIVGKGKEKKLADNGINTINVNFLKIDGSKISHGVKKLRGEWIKHICENSITNYHNFGGEVVEDFGNKEKNNSNVVNVNIVCE